MNKNIIKLTTEIKFYIPTTEDKSTAINDERIQSRVREVAGQLSEWYGGATSSEGVGYYKADDGQLITERVVVVACMTDKLRYEIVADLLKYASTRGHEWGQESMLVEISGTGYIIPTTNPVK